MIDIVGFVFSAVLFLFLGFVVGVLYASKSTE